MIKKILEFKEYIELNIITLNKKNIAFILAGIFAVYFFMTNVLLYDLYDFRQGNTDGQCIETKNGRVCELKSRSYETDAYKARK
jgi:hypothetical protein